MEVLLRTIFEAFPEKSTITFNGKCSDCGDAVIINIIPTSEGFGLLGGAFVECSTDKYATKCPDCFKVNPKMIELYDTKPNVLPLFDKKDLLSSILSTQKWMRI
jgi:thiol-disulfide isomerase/thioredoxin